MLHFQFNHCCAILIHHKVLKLFSSTLSLDFRQNHPKAHSSSDQHITSEQVSILTHNSKTLSNVEEHSEPKGTIPTFTHDDTLARKIRLTLVEWHGFLTDYEYLS